MLASGEPAWIVDAPEDANFPRADAARRGGLHAAFGFPLRSPRGVVGVMEFFSRELREPDERLLDTMGVIGSQVGQFVTRRHAEEEVRASESRLRAMLEAALDAVVTMDHRGRVIGWNHAAEAIFGYRADEAIGRDMADLIVPPGLRQQHRQGLARFLEGQRPVILDRRMELTGMRRERYGVPGRADDHQDRAAGPADVHRLPAGHHRARHGGARPCAHHVPVSWRSPTPSGSASSATSTTAPSSG